MQKAKKVGTMLFVAVIMICSSVLGLSRLSISKASAAENVSLLTNSIIVSESNASVTSARETAFTLQDATTASESYTGLYVNALSQPSDASVAWKAKIDGVFKDSFEMEYLLATPAKYIDTSFTISICDLEGNEICKSKHVREWNDDVSQVWNSKITFSGDGITTSNNLNMLPAQGYYDAEATSMGKFIATLDGENNLTVKERKYESSTLTEVTLGTVSAPALENGFLVKFTSNAWIDSGNPTTISLLVASINGVATTGETVSASLDETNSAISYENEQNNSGVYAISSNTGSELKKFGLVGDAYIGSLRMRYVEEFSHSESFADKPKGTYPITVSKNGVSKDYVVSVVDAYLTSNLIKSATSTTPTVATAKTFTGGGRASGIFIPTSTTAWSVDLTGTFNDIMEMEYLLPDSPSYAVNTPLSIAICDLEGNVVCEVYHYLSDNSYISGNAWGGRVAFYVGGVVSGTSIADMYPAPKYYTSSGNGLGKLQVSLDSSNQLTVKAMKHSNGGDYLTTVGALSNASALENGFTVKIYSKAESGAKCASILITSINGVSTCDEALTLQTFVDDIKYYNEKNISGVNTIDAYIGDGLEPFTVKKNSGLGESCILQTSTEEINYTLEDFSEKTAGTYNITVNYGDNAKNYTVRVQTGRTITFNCNGGEPINSVKYGVHNAADVVLPTPERANWQFDGWYEASDSEFSSRITTLAGQDRDFDLIAKWIDVVAPVITLNGINETVTVDDANKFVIAKTDVTATDAAQGVLTESSILVEVKAPSGSSFVEWNSASFNSQLYGVYEIRYTAKDNFNNTSYVTRYIDYIPALAKLTVADGLPTEAVVGMVITLPTSSVEYATALTPTVSVVLNGKQVNITDGTFKPEEAGTYSVVYYVKDELDREIVKAYEIAVVDDTEKPVIAVEFKIETVKIGTAVTLPNATATDNVKLDGEVTVSVMIAGAEIAITDGAFIPQTAGLYTVRYMATDVNGLTTVTVFEILAVDSLPNDNNGNGKGWVKWVLVGCGGAVVISLATVGTVLLVKRKRKRK